MEFTYTIDGIEIVANEAVTEEEVKEYIHYIHTKNPGKEIASISLDFDGEDVGLGYHLQPESFEKIRRITGYLVGTVDRFNNGKRAEEKDRVKHA